MVEGWNKSNRKQLHKPFCNFHVLNSTFNTCRPATSDIKWKLRGCWRYIRIDFTMSLHDESLCILHTQLQYEVSETEKLNLHLKQCEIYLIRDIKLNRQIHIEIHNVKFTWYET